MDKEIVEEANRIIAILELSEIDNIFDTEVTKLAEINNISDIEVAKLVMKYMLKKINRLYFSIKYF